MQAGAPGHLRSLIPLSPRSFSEPQLSWRESREVLGKRDNPGVVRLDEQRLIDRAPEVAANRPQWSLRQDAPWAANQKRALDRVLR